MPTCRSVIAEGLRASRAIAPGDDPEADELAAGLEALQAIVLELHEGRGPLTDVDVTADYVAGENQRVRIQAGFTVNVTLPNAIAIWGAYDPYDYGFSAPLPYLPVQGSTGVADGIAWRQPRDGTRVEIVGQTQGLYFYRADINQWQAAMGLTLDVEIPLNARHGAHLGALVAIRVLEAVNGGVASPGLLARAARANAALRVRSGTARDRAVGEYF